MDVVCRKRMYNYDSCFCTAHLWNSLVTMIRDGHVKCDGTGILHEECPVFGRYMLVGKKEMIIL